MTSSSPITVLFFIVYFLDSEASNSSPAKQPHDKANSTERTQADNKEESVSSVKKELLKDDDTKPDAKPKKALKKVNIEKSEKAVVKKKKKDNVSKKNARTSSSVNKDKKGVTKKVSKPANSDQKVVPKKLGVKERLGTVPKGSKQMKVEESSENDEDSDSAGKDLFSFLFFFFKDYFSIFG